MNREDRFTLGFALRWLPYGRPPDEDVFLAFGMSPERYLDHLLDVLCRQWRHVEPSTAARLMRMCASTSKRSLSEFAIESPKPSVPQRLQPSTASARAPDLSPQRVRRHHRR